jgi:hypothetical protein
MQPSAALEEKATLYAGRYGFAHYGGRLYPQHTSACSRIQDRGFASPVRVSWVDSGVEPG